MALLTLNFRFGEARDLERSKESKIKRPRGGTGHPWMRRPWMFPQKLLGWPSIGLEEMVEEGGGKSTGRGRCPRAYSETLNSLLYRRDV